MGNSVDPQKKIELLLNEVKRVEKQRDDYRHRLSECQQQLKSSHSEQFHLTDLSDLTDKIVHDMRSGLGIIRNTIGFLEDDLVDSDHQNDLLKISRGLDFCELVLRNLSALGGQDIFQPKWVDLEAVGREVFFLLERKLVDVTFTVDAEPDAPKIMADEGQMKQVFMNLFKNAGEAMSEGGQLTLRIWRDNGMLRVEVSDTGHGISPENLEDKEKLFQASFTTKEAAHQGSGYGLGLYIVDTIIKRHGGQIDVESIVDEGTTFILRLPIEAE